jgi:hypothetical protein
MLRNEARLDAFDVMQMTPADALQYGLDQHPVCTFRQVLVRTSAS